MLEYFHQVESISTKLYSKRFQETTIPETNFVKINVAAVSTIELTDWLALVVDYAFEIVTWSA